MNVLVKALRPQPLAHEVFWGMYTAAEFSSAALSFRTLRAGDGWPLMPGYVSRLEL